MNETFKTYLLTTDFPILRATNVNSIFKFRVNKLSVLFNRILVPNYLCSSSLLGNPRPNYQITQGLFIASFLTVLILTVLFS